MGAANAFRSFGIKCLSSSIDSDGPVSFNTGFGDVTDSFTTDLGIAEVGIGGGDVTGAL